MKESRSPAVRELTVRYDRVLRRRGPARVTDAAGVVACLPRDAARRTEECAWAVHLDTRGRCLGVRLEAVGGLNASYLDLRPLLRAALVSGAVQLALAHNHPSGDPTPSPADLDLTRTVAAGCRAVGLALLDHVVVAAGSVPVSIRSSRGHALVREW